jgi:hypothetical protein
MLFFSHDDSSIHIFSFAHPQRTQCVIVPLLLFLPLNVAIAQQNSFVQRKSAASLV